MIDIKSLENDGLTWNIKPYRCNECFERGYEISIFCDGVDLIVTHVSNIKDAISFINSAKKAGIVNKNFKEEV